MCAYRKSEEKEPFHQMKAFHLQNTVKGSTYNTGIADSLFLLLEMKIWCPRDTGIS